MKQYITKTLLCVFMLNSFMPMIHAENQNAQNDQEYSLDDENEITLYEFASSPKVWVTAICLIGGSVAAWKTRGFGLVNLFMGEKMPQRPKRNNKKTVRIVTSSEQERVDKKPTIKIPDRIKKEQLREYINQHVESYKERGIRGESSDESAAPSGVAHIPEALPSVQSTGEPILLAQSAGAALNGVEPSAERGAESTPSLRDRALQFLGNLGKIIVGLDQG